MAELFGYEFKRKDKKDQLPSFVAPSDSLDRSITPIESSAVGSAYSTALDIEGTSKTEADLIVKYRNMAANPKMDVALESIINEAIIYSSNYKTVQLVLDDIPELPETLQKTLNDEFNNVLNLLDFNNKGLQLFRQWYVDGRLYFHAVVDPRNLGAGIQQLRIIDPTRIRKVREKVAGAPGSAPVFNEFYLYNINPLAVGQPSAQLSYTGNQTSTSRLKISKDAIVFATSGITDATESLTLSYIHKAIKPLNCLTLLEDASVIYRIVRAPERRVFNVDVGNLPKHKAEQYLREVMAKYKNKLQYDAGSGEIRDDRKYMTMTEDFWMPRRGDGKGTTIDVLAGGQNLGEMGEVEYFRRELFTALNLPLTRMDAENSIFDSGTATQIHRDEVLFFKFIQKLRARFASLFTSALEKNIVLKNIMTIDEFAEIRNKIRYDFYSDNNFNELRTLNLYAQRLTILQQADPFVGKYFSREKLMKDILNYTDEDIEMERDRMDQELADGTVPDPNDPNVVPPSQ